METIEKVASGLGMPVNEFLALGDENNDQHQGHPDPSNIIDLNHEKMVSRFQNKEMAYKINEALIQIERLNSRTFEDMANFILQTCEDVTRLSKFRPKKEQLKLVKKK